MGSKIKNLDRDKRISLASDALGGKAVSTLKKRVGQARHLIAFCDRQGYKAFPVDGQVVEEYLDHLINSGAGHAKMTGVLRMDTFWGSQSKLELWTPLW